MVKRQDRIIRVLHKDMDELKTLDEEIKDTLVRRQETDKKASKKKKK